MSPVVVVVVAVAVLVAGNSCAGPLLGRASNGIGLPPRSAHLHFKPNGLDPIGYHSLGWARNSTHSSAGDCDGDSDSDDGREHSERNNSLSNTRTT